MSDDIKKLQEADFTVPGVKASVAGPVTPEGGDDNSKASKKGKPEMPMEKLKAVQEDLAALFDGTDLTEDFKEKATVIFEAAINEKVAVVVSSLEEQYAESLTEEVAAIEAALIEKLDSYLDYVVEQWVEDNALAIESGIKSDISESFMEGLKKLMEEHYISLPEEKIDVAGSLADKISELETQLSQAIDSNIELSKELAAATAEKTFADVAEGLVASQVDKFRMLAEGIESDSVEQYRKKLEMIKESYFMQKKPEARAAQMLNEAVESAPQVVGSADPVMAKYAEAITRSVNRTK